MTTLQAQIDAIVTGAGLSIACMTFDGGEVSRDVTSSRDPGALYPRQVPGGPTIGNVTVGVDYDEPVHGPKLPVLRKAATDRTEFSIGHIRRDGAGNTVGQTTYTGILIRVSPPAGNTNGGTDKAALELEFAVSGVNG